MDAKVGDQGGEGPKTPAARGGPAGDEARLAAADLRAAMRVARVEDAERSRAIANVHSAEIARLDLLREAIDPVLAAVPDEVEMFDAGLIPVPRPRLFIDMVAFVEMAHDKRQYRFVQDTRRGRLVLAESDRLEVMREAVTAYVARRLVEREKELADPAEAPLALAARPPDLPGAQRFAWLRSPAAVALNYLGIAALCVLLWVLGHALYQALGSAHR